MTKPTELQVINAELEEFGVQVRAPVHLCRECRFAHGPRDGLKCEINREHWCFAVNPRGECDRWESRESTALAPRRDLFAPVMLSVVAASSTVLGFLAGFAWAAVLG